VCGAERQRKARRRRVQRSEREPWARKKEKFTMEIKRRSLKGGKIAEEGPQLLHNGSKKDDLLENQGRESGGSKENRRAFAKNKESGNGGGGGKSGGKTPPSSSKKNTNRLPPKRKKPVNQGKVGEKKKQLTTSHERNPASFSLCEPINPGS